MDEKILKGLNKTIEKLREENNTLWRYKEAFFDMERRCIELKKQLEIKRNVVTIIGYKKDDPLVAYSLMILDSIDTSEGLFIKVQL